MPRKKIADYAKEIKTLNGDPHYIALGFAIGVFVAVTPTVPFHTVLAVALAFLLRASKPAALISVWISNPFTVVFLYLASYKAGYLFFNDTDLAVQSRVNLIENLESNMGFSHKIRYLGEFIVNKMDVFLIMNLGGLILGLPMGIAAYFIVRGSFVRLRKKQTEQKV